MPPGQDRAAKLTAAVIVSTLLPAPSWLLELAAASVTVSGRCLRLRARLNEGDVVFWK